MARYFTEEQELIRQVAKDFAENEVKPRAIEIEKANYLPHDLMERMGELGLLACLLPEEMGGLDQGYTVASAIIEEVAKESPALATSAFVQMGAPGLMLGDPAVAQKYGSAIMAGEQVFAVAMTPPEGSTNTMEWKPCGKLDGDEWVLNATRMFVTNTNVADVILLVGLTDQYQPGCWFVKKGTPGLEDNHVERKMGVAGNNSGTYVFTNVRVPREDFVPMNGAFRLDHMLMLCSAVALGCAEAAFQKTFEYLKVRTRAGQPIFSKQAVTHKLADIKCDIEMARSLLYDAAYLADAGQAEEASMLTSIAKVKVPKMCAEAVQERIFLYGGLGYMEDTGIARYMRDAVGMSVADGTPGLHREQIAALLGCEGAERLF